MAPIIYYTELPITSNLNLQPEIYNNYKKIEFFPNKFHEYLLSPEVGFSHSYTLGVPRHMNKGFCRPIQVSKMIYLKKCEIRG